MPPRKQDKYVQPKDSFTGDLDGEPVTVTSGMILHESDPIVRKWPQHFQPLAPSRQRPAVEQATQAPGETRPVKV